jgi:hypothetical protein
MIVKELMQSQILSFGVPDAKRTWLGELGRLGEDYCGCGCWWCYQTNEVLATG